MGSKNKRLRGEWTAEAAGRLKLEFPDLNVFFDHGQFSGRIVSYFGNKNERGTQLSYLDIAVVEKETNQAIALVEIEETANRPKTIIADIFAFLLGQTVVYKETRLHVNNKTTFIILGFSQTEQPEHTEHIIDKVGSAKSALDTENSQVGKVIIEVYSSKEQLLDRLTTLVGQAIGAQQ